MTRPLVLMHGLWDTPRLFRRLIQAIDAPEQPLLAPHLPHGLGVVPLREMARRLDRAIQERFGPDTEIDLFGFSMGGVIGRIWLQELDGARRTRRFFSVGSPQQGTLAALPIPRLLLAGAADMKPGSAVLRDLNRSDTALADVDLPQLLLSLGSDGVSGVAGGVAGGPAGGIAGLDPPATHRAPPGCEPPGGGSAIRGGLIQAA